MTDKEKEFQEALGIARDVVAFGARFATKTPEYCLDRLAKAFIELVKERSDRA